MQGIPPVVTLRAIRESQGITSAELLAEQIAEHGVQVHPDSLRNVELGYKRAGRQLLRAWAAVLGLESTDIQQANEVRGLVGGQDTRSVA